MICLGYDSLEQSTDRWRARPNCPEPVGRFNATHLLPLSVMPGLTCAPTDALVRDGRPFVYPLELSWNWSRTLTTGPESFAPGLPAAVLEAVRRGRASLLLSLVEATPLAVAAPEPLWLFDLIQRFIEAQDLPPERVWLVSGRVDALGSFAAWLMQRGCYEPEVFRFRTLQPCVSLVRAAYHANAQGWEVETTWHDDFTITVKRSAFSADAFAARYVTPEEIAAEQRGGALRPKRFLSFNRHTWAHRIHVASYLQARGYIDDSLVSFAATSLDAYGDANAAPVLHPLVLAGWRQLQSRLPLAVDEGSPVAEGFVGDIFLKLANAGPYRQTYFNLTTESQFEPPAFHTEKIMKPLLNLQPFLCVGSPDTLRYLRAIGFKTFGRLIDESYDLPAEPATRLIRIFRQIDVLAQLSPAQARDLYFAALPEMIHNRAHLIEGPHQLDALWVELEAQLG